MIGFILIMIIVGLIYHFEPFIDINEGLLWYNSDRRTNERKYIELW